MSPCELASVAGVALVGICGSSLCPSLRIRLTKKTNVRKFFAVDLWEQPIPKRWKADVFRDVVSNGQSVGVVRYGVGSSHLGEPLGIG